MAAPVGAGAAQPAPENEMKERPILFSGPMVRAILEGRKTQTRRIFKDTISADCIGVEYAPELYEWRQLYEYDGSLHKKAWGCKCPYGQPGDRLWVRETWAYVPATAYRQSAGVEQTPNPNDPEMAAVYRAEWDRCAPGQWKPSIHMPRWASRITLELTGLRIQRVQDITEQDARREGAIYHAGAPNNHSGWRHDIDHGFVYESARASFRALWDSINAKRNPYHSNPWVWVIEFCKI